MAIQAIFKRIEKMRLLENYHKTLIIIFLELLSFSPIFMILGNIIPPFPIKFHLVTFGLIFLLIGLFLIQYRSKKWLVYTVFFYFIIQFFLSGLNLKDFIDFFFGPFVFIALVDLLFNKRIPKIILWKYQKRFFTFMLIPMFISGLQFMEILPLTFWNATYVNYSIVDGVHTPRPNGFLYHGSELSIIIFFVALKQLIKTNKHFLLLSLFILLIAYGTYYKALTATIVLLIAYYYIFIKPLRYFQWTHVIFKYEKKLYLVFLSFFFLGIFILFYKVQIQEIKEVFNPELLTGRGAIWNVYLKAIKEFSFFEYLFGAGIGSEAILFTKYATPELYYPLKVNPNSDLTPDGHNAVLSTFLNVGIIGSLLYLFLFKIIHSQMIKLKNTIRAKAVFFLILVVTIFTIGVTIPIFKNAIYWIGLGFIIYHWFGNSKEHQNEYLAIND